MYEYQIILALILDWLIGDPRNSAHPVRLIGSLAVFAENRARNFFSSERRAGISTVIFVILAVYFFTSAIIDSAGGISYYLGFVVSVVVIYTGLAARDLYDHAMNVYRALELNDIVEARRRVGMICGRDTDDMDSEAVIRATVESIAENLVDGVTCPLFYAFLGGPKAIMVYKAISTMDSMFGYKNERYKQFGWAPARLDDLAAFIPSRVTGILVPVASIFVGLRASDSLRIFLRDRSRHPSPNAGQSESAFAGALGIRLGGPSKYHGVTHEKQYLGDSGDDLNPEHIVAALRLMTATMVVFCVVTLAVIHAL